MSKPSTGAKWHWSLGSAFTCLRFSNQLQSDVQKVSGRLRLTKLSIQIKSLSLAYRKKNQVYFISKNDVDAKCTWPLTSNPALEKAWNRKTSSVNHADSLRSFHILLCSGKTNHFNHFFEVTESHVRYFLLSCTE